jgi:uncharacterized protein
MVVFQMIKVNISEVTKVDGALLEVKFQGKIAELENGIDDFKFNDAIDLKGTIYNSGGSLNLDGNVISKYITFCSKCLIDFERTVSVDLQENFVEKTAEMDEEVYFYEGNYVILDKAVADNIILQLPMKPVCTEMCKGVCPICGANLNKEDCKCEKEASTDDSDLNPKMGALKKLMKDMELYRET